MTLDISTALLVFGIVSVAGIMRGITGFGGAMLMTPPLGFLLGPVPAVVISLGLEAMAALIMVPAIRKDLPLKQFALLIIPACLAIPIGTQLLLGVDAVLGRRMIGAMVTASSLAMLVGLRYERSAHPSLLVAIGALAGVLLGATGIGAPPVVLILLSGPSPIRNTRAILTVFISTTSLIGFASLCTSGAVTMQLLAATAALTLCYLGTTWIGMKAFTRLTDHGVRTIALCMMLLVGTSALLV